MMEGWPRSRVEQYAQYGSGEKQEIARREIQRRDQARRKFIRELSDDELQEIVTAPQSKKLGVYSAQAAEFGVNPTRDELEALAEQEHKRRQRARQREQQQAQSSRGGGLLSLLTGK